MAGEQTGPRYIPSSGGPDTCAARCYNQQIVLYTLFVIVLYTLFVRMYAARQSGKIAP